MSDFRLKVFRSVASNLSFTKASQELFITQPAITKHIQELESQYKASNLPAIIKISYSIFLKTMGFLQVKTLPLRQNSAT